MTCWTEQNASRLLQTLATVGDQASFLARHSRISGFHAKSQKRLRLEEFTDIALRGALAESKDHALVVVEGEAGSGKSHLIRWIHITWPGGQDDLVAWIAKSRNSLWGTYNALRDNLPDDLKQTFAELNEPPGFLTDRGRSQKLLANLALLSDRKNAAGLELDDWAWVTGSELQRLLSEPELPDVWAAPGRIARFVKGADGGDATGRLFTLQDVYELVDAAAGRIEDRASRLVELIEETEHERLGEVLKSGRNIETLTPLERRRHLSHSVKLVRALNGRLRYAIQDLVGVSREAIQDAFRKLRARIAEQGDYRRLVLFLEDITNMQGVDNQLLEALQVEAADESHQEKLCPMVSVVGITPGFWNDLVSGMTHLRDRISLHIDLTPDEHSTRSVALGDHAGKALFVARYLNASRLSVEELETWCRISPDGTAPVPNRCASCETRSQCLETFGSVACPGIDGVVGLFPFTQRAIQNFYDALPNDEKTPRAMIQMVMSPVLSSAGELDAGTFPPARIDNAELQRGSISGACRKMLLGVAESDRARAELLLTRWGDQDAQLFDEQNGARRCGGVHEGVFEKFGIEVPFRTAKPVVVTTGAEQSQKPTIPMVGQSMPAPVPVQTPRPVVPTSRKARLPEFEALGVWVAGGSEDLGDHRAVWGTVLNWVMKSVPWSSLRIPPWAREYVFSERYVVLAGSQASTGRGYLVLDPNGMSDRQRSVLQEGLEAAWHLRGGEEEAFTLRMVALQELVGMLAFLVERHWTGLKLEQWDLHEDMICSLVVYYWITRQGLPSAPAIDTWCGLFSMDTHRDPTRLRGAARVALERCVSGIPGRSSQMESVQDRVDRVQQALCMGTGSSGGMKTLLDGAAGYRAVQRSLGWRVAETRRPDEVYQSTLAKFDRVTRALPLIVDAVERAVQDEVERSREVARGIVRVTQNYSIGEFVAQCRRLQDEVGKVDAALVRDSLWTEALSQEGRMKAACRNKQTLQAEMRIVDDWVVDLMRGLPSKWTAVERLSWLGRRSAHEDEIARMVEMFARALEDLHSRAKALRAQSPVQAGVQEIQAVGKMLQKATISIQSPGVEHD